jgi:DNA-binding MarR family transcriptional regulator
MIPDVYKQLFEVMTNRRGPYTGMDIPEFYTMAQALFTPAEAEVNNVMLRKPSTAKDIAKALDRTEQDVVAIIETMADKGLCKTFLKDDVRYYQGEPFWFT